MPSEKQEGSTGYSVGGSGYSMVLYWVVQRNAGSGVLITFRSFADYEDAEKHRAELADYPDNNAKVAIEPLPLSQSPR